MAINWLRIHDVRAAARDLAHQFKVSPEVTKVLNESFDDFQEFRSRIERLAHVDRGAKIKTLNETMNLTGVSSDALPRMIARGDFPSPIYDEPELFWLASDLTVWIQERRSN